MAMANDIELSFNNVTDVIMQRRGHFLCFTLVKDVESCEVAGEVNFYFGNQGAEQPKLHTDVEDVYQLRRKLDEEPQDPKPNNLTSIYGGQKPNER